MRHPPKPSRKKLRGEIARLKGQLLTMQVINRAAIAVAQCQIGVLRDELASLRTRREYTGEVVTMPAEKAFEAGDVVKV